MIHFLHVKHMCKMVIVCTISDSNLKLIILLFYKRRASEIEQRVPSNLWRCMMSPQKLWCFLSTLKCREWIGEHTRWDEGKGESALAYGESTIESQPGESPVGLDLELNLRVRAHERAVTNEQSTGAVNVWILIRPVPQWQDSAVALLH
jgi:hypothetical protein